MTRDKSKRRKRKIKPEFADLATTKQGAAGEAIALQYFAGRGWIAYPVGVEGPHPVDFIVYNPASGKLIAVEVKTYPRLFSSEETGIDLADYKFYIDFEKQNGIEVWLLFVDVFEERMYGAFISYLRPGARSANGKKYFRLGRFKKLPRLTPAELETLEPPPNPARYRYLTPYFPKE
ncbi:hypothetical protein FUA23_06595 [Neolewinella aurantiaca]|uniref:Uncharacterized protein n=1 Tax=Neolewinella aurantiaca TaxID=2602767 RepID=A0A5C7FY11_9BACT|nr:hypothetical protein [Neolewinella aurantiaca]TXF90452.1 hypothetical protein FUA23_06595 [Neolewinella aurantiaca]